MKILISGGTGLIGSKLCKFLLEEKHEVSVLTRSVEKAHKILGGAFDGAVTILSELSLDAKYDVIINLAGESLNNKNWTSKLKEKFIESRIARIKLLADFINQAKHKPSLFIGASAIGYYGNDYNEVFTEDSAPDDQSYAHKLCSACEEASKEISGKTRVCIIRIGVVLSNKGGALAEMLPAFRYGFGIALGNGRQPMSWIHINDVIRAIDFIIKDKKASGVFNLTAPTPVTQEQFANELAGVLGRPRILRLPNFFVELIFGEMGNVLLLQGAKVHPKKLLDNGFEFAFPALKGALTHLTSSANS